MNTKLIGAALLIAVASLPVAAQNEALAVMDYSGRSHGLGSLYVRTSINTSLALRLIQEKLALLVISKYDSKTASCMSTVGITTPTPNWHTPRIPNYTATTLLYADTKKPDHEADCIEHSIRQSVLKLNEYDANKIVKEAVVTFPMGGVRQATPERKSINFITFGIKGEHLNIKEFNVNKFETAFDYRNVSVVVDASAWNEENYVKCSALAGVTSTPPSGRNPYMPAHWFFASMALRDGSGDDCKKLAAALATRKLLDQPYTETGLLLDFERTREIGVPTPSSASVFTALNPNGSKSSGIAPGKAAKPICPSACSGANCIGPKTFGAAKDAASDDACRK